MASTSGVGTSRGPNPGSPVPGSSHDFMSQEQPPQVPRRVKIIAGEAHKPFKITRPKPSLNDFEWGAISDDEDPIVNPEEVIKSIIRSAVKHENPKIKLPVTENEEAFVTLPPELTPQNDIIQHTIQLNQHAKIVKKMIRITAENPNELRKCPPVPDLLARKRLLLRLQQQKAASEPEIIDLEAMPRPKPYEFAVGQAPALPLLANKTIDDMLRRAVIIILAQTGFDTAANGVIQTLVDIVKGIMTRLTQVLHHLSQKDILKDPFKDTVEKSFRDVGLAGMAALGEYWRKNVIAKNDKAFNKSCRLFNCYTKLVNKLVSQFANQVYNPFGITFQPRNLWNLIPEELTRALRSRATQELLRTSRLFATPSAVWHI